MGLRVVVLNPWRWLIGRAFGPLHCLAPCWLVCTAQAATADGWQGSAGVLSDKVVYGLSQSGGDPSMVLDLACRGATGWSLAGGVATLGRGGQRPDAEFSLGGGVGGALGDSGAWQVNYQRVETSGRAGTRRPGYNQFSLAYGHAEQLQLTLLYSGGFSAPAPAAAGASPSGSGRVPSQALITEATWHQPLVQRWALDLGLGRVNYSRETLRDFSYGSIGLSWGLGPVQIFATRVFSNSRAPAAVGSRAVVSVLWGF